MTHYKSALSLLHKVAQPVLDAASNRRLKLDMPVETNGIPSQQRSAFTHLEAVGRLLAGISPLLESYATGSMPDTDNWLTKAHETLASCTDPESPDFLNFSEGSQPLVDAAFLAQAILRAPNALWHGLDDKTRSQIKKSLDRTRVIRPHFNNWLLFSAIVEAFFCLIDEPWDRMRVDYAIRQHEQWYKGDGYYGDGPQFHWDYYNSFVIQPMLLDILDVTKGQGWDSFTPHMLSRAKRHSVILERLIGTDGSFPPIGRSLAYRCAAFHLLAQLAWRKMLPPELSEAQVRGALLAAINATLGSETNFDDKGWLRIGLNGSQASLGENYISTGSLYLCAVAFMPLGLADSDDFWTSPDKPWTQREIWWLQRSIETDKAL